MSQSAISMRALLEAGAHFGHQTRYWNPKMAPYIFGARNKVHIINLEKTIPLLHDAINFASNIAAHRGKILFVGTKRQAQTIIAEEAIRCGMPFANDRWRGGTLTNFKTIRQSLKRLAVIEKTIEDPSFNKVIKKEGLKMQRELSKLDRSFGGLRDMGGLPDALFVIDTGMEKTAISEAKRLKIPVIGIVDTNHDPEVIDYPIPGNDDASRAIALYVRYIADAIIAGRQSNTVAPREEVQSEEQAS